jgi:signal transduction histidine kinase
MAGVKSSLAHNRKAIARIVALAAAIIVIVASGGVALLVYAAGAIDRAHIDEKRALVANYMREREHDLVGQIVSASVWDEAYVKLEGEVDPEWADLYVGSYFTTYMQHAASFVLDDQDRPRYAWRDGGRIDPHGAGSFLHQAAPLVAQVRELERTRGAARRRGLTGAIIKTGFVLDQGQLYIVAVGNIVPETVAVKPRPGASHLLVSARRIDPAFLGRLAGDMRLGEVRLTLGDGAAQSALPIADVSGRQVANLRWTPSLPGAVVLRQIAPLFALALCLLLAAAAALAARVRAVFRRIDLNDAALQRSLDELVRARDEADAANLAKSQFLANMSHEIRTPLNGVLGMTQIMAREDLTPAQRDQLDVVRDSGQTLLALLNDILDISKIEAGRLEIDNHEFDLAAAVHAACMPFASLADHNDVAFRIEIDERARGVWLGDGARLRQVLANLASNAVKFTARGEIAVHVSRCAQGLRFVVRDTGLGIPAQRLAALFEKFNQGDASTTRRFGGTGLGLAISHELTALMGGELAVESIEGQGSTFTVTLPMRWRSPALTAPLPTPAVQARAVESGARVRILAAEDNPTNQLVLRAMLEPFDVDLTLAADGREAVESYAAAKFDLILMDVQMPVMNGVEAALAIRRLEAERNLPATPILALSANVMAHQVAEYLAAGMNGFVPKPIETARLLGAIDEALCAAGDLATRAA